MKYIRIITTYFFVLNCITLFSQWNIQAGYDFGVMKIPTSENSYFKINSKWDFVHRINLIGEFSSENNVLFSINGGVDFHNILRDQERKTSNNTGELTIYSGRFDARIQTFRIGLGVGYMLEINDVSKIALKLNINQCFINKIRLVEWTFIKEVYENQNTTSLQTVEFPSENLNNEVGFKNKWRMENFNSYLSIEYRHQLSISSGVNLFIGYTPFNNRIYPKTTYKRNLIMLGGRFCYTFPQKSDKDEK